MEKNVLIEISKRKMSELHYRKRVCRLLTAQVVAMQGLIHSVPSSNQRYGEYQIYLDDLNKVWAKLKDKETLVFDSMITAGLKATEIDDVMRYAEAVLIDEYSIYEVYGINPGEIENNERKIRSISDVAYKETKR